MAASHFLTGTHHCAILHGDEHGLANQMDFKNCTLHPGHKEFMTVDECLSKKPSEIGLRNRYRVDRLRDLIDLTARVVVHHTSVDRPDTFINSENPYPCKDIRGDKCLIRYGTGCLVKRYDDNNGDEENGNVIFNKPCTCRECRKTTRQMPNRKSYYFVIVTATHVIFDEQEARRAVFEFFYDSENRSGVKQMYGVSVIDSRYLRLQTDQCSVVCITHDGELAEKMGDLCKRDNFLANNRVLVSHPHGVSKMISFADHNPKRNIAIISNKTSVQLKKGMGIRFPGYRNATHIVQDTNLLLDKRVIVWDDTSKTFVLDCDVTVSRPEGVVVDFLYKKHGIELMNKVWCNVFYPGTQLAADGGKRYTFSYNDDRARMEVFGETEKFFDKNDKNSHSVFMYNRNTMASCPGSSGARVAYFQGDLRRGFPGHVHFGNSGDFNTSSLFCLYTPDSEEQGSEPNHMHPSDHGEDRIKQKLYDKIFKGRY